MDYLGEEERRRASDGDVRRRFIKICPLLIGGTIGVCEEGRDVRRGRERT